MSNLPKYFIMQVWEEISSHINIPDILEHFSNTDKFSLIHQIYSDNFKNDEIQENLRNNRKRRTQTKKRWVQSILNDYNDPSGHKPKDLRQEYLFLSNYLTTFGMQQFQQLFNKNSPEEIITEKIKSLEAWCEDTNVPLSNYSYLSNKSNSQKEKAIISDISIIIGDLIMKKYDGKIQDMIVEKPYSYVDNPIFSENRGKLSLSEDEIQDGLFSYYYNDYSPSSDYRLRVLVSKEYAQEKQVRLLDNTDESIFSQVLQQRGNVFATQRKIFFNIGKIVKNLFSSDGIENYKVVESRLYKMLNMRFNVFYKEGSIGFGIFDYVQIDYNNGWTAEVSVNEQIYQEYLNKQTIRMYKDIMQKFELPLSRNLIFVLQKERFYCYSEKQPYKQSYEYSYFSHKLQFKGRNKKENIKLIEASLNEIIKHGVGIKSFSRQGEQFHLEYIPITEYEVEDLIHSSSSSDHIFDFASPTSLIEPVNR